MRARRDAVIGSAGVSRERKCDEEICETVLPAACLSYFYAQETSVRR